MANIVRTQLKKSLNIKQRSIQLQNEIAELKAKKEANIKAARETFDELNARAKALEKQHEPMDEYSSIWSMSTNPSNPVNSLASMQKKRNPIRQASNYIPQISKEVQILVGDKFQLLKPHKTIKPPKITPLNAFQRIKRFEEKHSSRLNHSESNDTIGGLKETKAIRAYKAFYTPSPNSKVYATPDMPIAQSEYEVKGIVSDLQMSIKLPIQTLPVYQCDFFQLDYFPPEHILSHFRKSRPAIKVQYKDGFLLNDVEFDKMYNKKKLTLNHSYYPRDYAFIRWKWRRLIKKEFFKAFKELDGLDGFYTFRVKLFPTEQYIETFRNEIKASLNAAIKKENHCIKVSKRHNLSVNPSVIDSAIKIKNFPPLTLLPGVQLKPTNKCFSNVIHSKSKVGQNKETRPFKGKKEQISDILNFLDEDDYDDDYIPKTKSETQYSINLEIMEKEAEKARYDKAVKMIESGKLSSLSPRIQKIIKHLKY
ncbi:hypothetical protein BN7_6692 [Wickerhamomyces ciferrii]|uniref:Uncharacterized protein n=1 Tax=Wickerhamomyces ciferrii (strain ATCC 14091 / BCRC 22168 / CBS 111 / JCM 3599 / NBRC 0793 / NRRL Y-1031 F-60-10) TaxID=1206466 RepID=K0L0V5_WICCF|nr:uncharacterized protein BN7_6692 [Wickerhamomyces ciferrii]CCH47083.1 hypothetical protein BN7_6692 [Wickerhamomyces ciferrii]